MRVSPNFSNTIPKLWLLAALEPLSLGVGQSPIETVDRTLDQIADSMIAESSNGLWYGETSFAFDVWYYHRDETRFFQGLWFPDEEKHSGTSARATLDIYLEYDRWASIKGKFRLDDGEHAGLSRYVGKGDTDMRTDELYLNVSADPWWNLRVGQFTPLLTPLLSRQSSWSSGLINTPLAYEGTTSLADVNFPSSEESFLRWRNFISPLSWIPAIWAPLYTRGIEASGGNEKWSYLATVLNSSLSSRGDWWNDNVFDHPTFAGRLGYTPNAAWEFGALASRGTYLHYTHESFSTGERELPVGSDFDDFQQTILGLDASFAVGDWELWSEAFWVDYDVPNVADNAAYLSYFLEVRYSMTPKTWLSFRWSEELFHKMDTSDGRQKWMYDRNRLDMGIGFRFSRHAQIKAQIADQRSKGPEQLSGLQFLLSTNFKL